MTSAQAFGRILKKLRLLRGISQAELASHSGLDRTYISLLELGKRQPSLPTMIALANALRVGVADLMAQFEAEFATAAEQSAAAAPMLATGGEPAAKSV